MSYDISKVPAEIWLHIFAQAAHIPGALTCEDGRTVAALATDVDAICLHKWYREALDTKLATSLVSRAWNAMAVQFLYEYLLIKDEDHAVQIAAALTRHSNNCASSNPAGTWTRRLELALDGVQIWTPTHLSALGQIIKSCPKLTVLSTVVSTSDAHLWEISQLDGALCSSLQGSQIRRLECREDLAIIPSFLSSFSNTLQVLCIAPSSTRDHRTILCPACVNLPQLHTLILSGDTFVGHSILSWALPSLTTLVVNPGHSGLVGKVDMLIERMVKQLKCLSTGCYYLPSAHSSMKRLLAVCPSLDHWTTDCFAVLMGRDIHLLTALQSLTISMDSVEKVQMCPLVFKTLLQSVSSAGCCPLLKRIRFYLPLRVECEKNKAIHLPDLWNVFLSNCDLRGILLEASYGAEEHAANIWRPTRRDFDNWAGRPATVSQIGTCFDYSEVTGTLAL